MADHRTTKRFHIGDILSITTGVLVSTRRIEGVYDILNFLTSDNLFTHQLPRAGREMAPRLLAQHPDLADVDASGCNRETHAAWLAVQVAKYGETREVRTEHQFHEVRDPIEEAVDFVGPGRVIALDG